MIVECESCKNKFRLDENLLKNTGTKVRCSVCKNVFTVYLPEEKLGIEGVSLGDEEKEVREEREDSDFDKIFSHKIEEEIEQEQGEVEPISIDDLPDLGQDYQEHMDAKKIDSDREAAKSDMAEEEGLVQEEIEEREMPGEEEGLIRHHEIIKKRRRPGLLATLLLLFFLIVGAGAALLALKPEFLFKRKAQEQQIVDMGNIRLSFKDVKGSFKISEKLGKIFVVSGLVVNNYQESRDFIRIKSNILDSKGKVVKSRIVYAGNPISDKELLTISMDDINRMLMNKLGKDSMNVNILPNSSVPFVIIFNMLPDDMSEFTVEAISSSKSAR